MKMTNWFNMKQHRPVREGRYQIITSDPGLKGVSEYADARPHFWSFRRNTWYLEYPGQRPARVDSYFVSKAFWRGIA